MLYFFQTRVSFLFRGRSSGTGSTPLPPQGSAPCRPRTTSQTGSQQHQHRCLQSTPRSSRPAPCYPHCQLALSAPLCLSSPCLLTRRSARQSPLCWTRQCDHLSSNSSRSRFASSFTRSVSTPTRSSTSQPRALHSRRLPNPVGSLPTRTQPWSLPHLVSP